MHIVIMGCGRVGASLATALATEHSVSVIDRSPLSLRRLGNNFPGKTVVGMGFDRDVQIAAGIETAQAFAAVSSGDNSNIVSARVAKETFGVPRVIARIYDYKRAAVYERLGIPTITTVPWTTNRFLRALTGEQQTVVWDDPTGTMSITELVLHEQWVSHTVADLENTLGVRVAYISRFGTTMLPSHKTVLTTDDHVFVAVPTKNRDTVLYLASKPPLAESN